MAASEVASGLSQAQVSTAHRITAVLLGAIAPGAGYVVLGRWQRGLGVVLLMSLCSSIAGELAARGRFVGTACVLAFALVCHLGALVDVARLDAADVPSTGRAVLTILGLVVLGNLEAVALRMQVVETFCIPSGSMIPTVEVRDRVVVDKRSRLAARGDVAVFRSIADPSKEYMKRVVAVGGDTIEIGENDRIIVNGKPVPHVRAQGDCSYEDLDDDAGLTVRSCVAYDEQLGAHSYRVVEEPQGRGVPVALQRLPADTYFFVGDNRNNSNDSRYFGPVPAANVNGIARFVFWGRGRSRMGVPIR